MGIFDAVRDRWKARKREKTREAIFAALDRAYSAADERELAATDRVVIFSDLHKGARDGADDFQRCERAYNAALAYYNHLGYDLIELGDVEELWENSFDEIAASYPQTLRLAAAFHDDGRYLRLFGNHDLAWKQSERFEELMGKHGFSGVEPLEALRIVVNDSTGRRVGELFLVHGHQGKADSDRHANRSAFFVRRGWRPLQMLLNRPWNTPSVDWALRGEHADTMATWAGENHRVLIAGHTHLPVFFNERKEAEATPADVPAVPGEDPQVTEARRRARVEWAKAEVERLRTQVPIRLDTPCYFNTGCCAFGDGDITGLEIRDNTIVLVRWPADPQVDRQPLTKPMALEEVFRLTA